MVVRLYLSLLNAGVAKLVRHSPCKREILMGSSPSASSSAIWWQTGITPIGREDALRTHKVRVRVPYSRLASLGDLETLNKQGSAAVRRDTTGAATKLASMQQGEAVMSTTLPMKMQYSSFISNRFGFDSLLSGHCRLSSLSG